MFSSFSSQVTSEKETRKTGISIFDNIPWGTHSCVFYQKKEELLEIAIPFFKTGLENNEFCMWVIPQSLSKEEAIQALQAQYPSLKTSLQKGQIVITTSEDWYGKPGKSSMQAIIQSWVESTHAALTQGYEGLRALGLLSCLFDKGWEDFMSYEKEVGSVVKQLRMVGICAYCTNDFTHNDTVDVVKRHEYVLTKRKQQWEVIESVEHMREKEAATHRKLQEQFIDTLCHELRNPLNGVFGSIDLAKETLKSMNQEFQMVSRELPTTASAPQAALQQQLSHLSEYIDNIHRCTKYQKSLVDDVLHVSKLQSQKLTLNETEFDPQTIILDACELFKTEIARKGLTLEREWQKQKIPVLGDPDRLKQILINLLSNAVKFNKPNGKIIVRMNVVERDNQSTELKFEVEDTGIGISEEGIHKLFNRFEQLGRNRQGEYEGSGLGLIISKGLVELMGGHFQVEGQLQKGTKFSFNVKLKTVHELQKDNEKDRLDQAKGFSAHAQRENIKILIVEDNAINQKILLKQLSQKGHTCLTANNGQEAVSLFHQQPLDIILMDIEMPVMDGIEATRIIRRSTRGEKSGNSNAIPILCLSGYTSDRYMDKAREAGINAYITKPCGKEELLNKINECLSQWDIRQSRLQLSWAQVVMPLTFFRANTNNSLLSRKATSAFVKNNMQMTLEYMGDT